MQDLIERQRDAFIDSITYVYKAFIEAYDAIQALDQEPEFFSLMKGLRKSIDTDKTLPQRLAQLREAPPLTKVKEGKAILWDLRGDFITLLNHGPDAKDADIAQKMHDNPAFFHLSLMMYRLVNEFARSKDDLKSIKEYLYTEYGSAMTFSAMADHRVSKAHVYAESRAMMPALHNAFMTYIRNDELPQDGTPRGALADGRDRITSIGQRIIALNSAFDRVEDEQAFDEIGNYTNELDQLKTTITQVKGPGIVDLLDDIPMEPHLLGKLLQDAYDADINEYDNAVQQLEARYDHLYSQGLSYEQLALDIASEADRMRAFSEQTGHQALVANQNVDTLLTEATEHQRELQKLIDAHTVLADKLSASIVDPQAAINRIQSDIEQTQSKLQQLNGQQQTAKALITNVWNFKDRVKQPEFKALLKLLDLAPQTQKTYLSQYKRFFHPYNAKRDSKLEQLTDEQKQTLPYKVYEAFVETLATNNATLNELRQALSTQNKLQAKSGEASEHQAALRESLAQCQQLLVELKNQQQALHIHQTCGSELARFETLNQNIDQFVRDTKNWLLTIIDALAKAFNVREEKLPAKLQYVHIAQTIKKELQRDVTPTLFDTQQPEFEGSKRGAIQGRRTIGGIIFHNHKSDIEGVKQHGLFGKTALQSKIRLNNLLNPLEKPPAVAPSA